MIDNTIIGERLRECRKKQRLTLKAIENLAGVSATHISEIERGKTSPTIGALSKIAHALGKDITFFVEDEPLADICNLKKEDMQALPLPHDRGSYTRLTKGIPGSRLMACLIHLDAGGLMSSEFRFDGNDVYYVSKGCVRFNVEGENFDLEEGDSIHLNTECLHSYQNPTGEKASLYHFSGHRRGV